MHQETQIGVVKFENGMRKCFCENVCGIVCTRNMREDEVFGKNMRMNKMKMDIYVFCVIMRNTIICKCNGTFIIRLNERGVSDWELIEGFLARYLPEMHA